MNYFDRMCRRNGGDDAGIALERMRVSMGTDRQTICAVACEAWGYTNDGQLDLPEHQNLEGLKATAERLYQDMFRHSSMAEGLRTVSGNTRPFTQGVEQAKDLAEVKELVAGIKMQAVTHWSAISILSQGASLTLGWNPKGADLKTVKGGKFKMSENEREQLEICRWIADLRIVLD